MAYGPSVFVTCSPPSPIIKATGPLWFKLQRLQYKALIDELSSTVGPYAMLTSYWLTADPPVVTALEFISDLRFTAEFPAYSCPGYL